MILDRFSLQVRDGLIKFSFYFLLLSYPLLSFLWRRSYPVFTEEVLCLFAGIFGLSLTLSLISAHIRPAISYLLTIILVLLSLMIQFNLLVEGILVCIALTTLLLAIFRQRFHLNAIPILFALLIGAYLDSGHEPLADRSEENSTLVNTELGPVVHIILDSFIGIAGLPQYPASDLIRQEILSFFSSNNFQLFSHAYSRFTATGSSLYTSMNFRHDGASLFPLEAIGRRKHVLQENAVFNALEDLDYRFKIYQTGHLDFCQTHPNVLDRCWQYDHPNVNSVQSSNDLLLKIHALSKILVQQSTLLFQLAPSDKGLKTISIAAHDPRIFDVLEQDIGNNSSGYYFFAHALIPHTPFIYQADCSVNYTTQEVLRNTSLRDEPVLPDDVYEVRNGLYYAQVECALRNMQSLIDRMKKAGVYERVTIILHGDHGSLISRQPPYMHNHELLSKEDYRSSFSTLFAVKYPGSQFAIDESPLPIS